MYFDDQDVQLMDAVITQMVQTECYQRLVCDLRASDKESPIIDLILEPSDPNLSGEAQEGLLKLREALAYGERIANVTACEQVYSQCPIKGLELHNVLAKSFY